MGTDVEVTQEGAHSRTFAETDESDKIPCATLSDQEESDTLTRASHANNPPPADEAVLDRNCELVIKCCGGSEETGGVGMSTTDVDVDAVDAVVEEATNKPPPILAEFCSKTQSSSDRDPPLPSEVS